MQAGHEPIADDELLYRRIPASTGWYSPDDGLNSQAFAPHKSQDSTGLSVSRAKYKTIEQAAIGRPGKSYYVAVLKAGELRRHGIAVAPRPLQDDPGHAELPDLNSADRKTDRVLQFQQILVQLHLRVEGPFSTA